MIIGFVGLIGSGKDMAADILVEEFDYFKESFANSVKDIVSIIFDWNRTWLEGEDKHSREWRETPIEYWSEAFGYEVTPRKMLQIIGTEAGRNIIHPDIWIHTTFRRMHPWNDYVISDVRFPNEVRSIQNAGGKVFRIRRGEDPEWMQHVQRLEYDAEGLESYMRVKYPNVHQSEWACANIKFDMIVENDSGFLELREKIRQLLLLQAA
jgi:hypothetical protein